MIDPIDGAMLVGYADGLVHWVGAEMVLSANVLCLRMRDGLAGIDPLTGRTLWLRPGGSPRCRIFGEGEAVFVVDLNDKDQPIGTQALRISDGVSVKAPDFAALYAKRVGRSGRTLAVSEPGPNEGTILHLYDVLSGKDLWKGDFPARSTLLRSVDPDLVGMVEPDGKVRVVSLRQRKEVLQAEVDPRHVKEAMMVWLLADSGSFYLAVSNPHDPKALPRGGARSNLWPGTGLHDVAVNGAVYCFNAQTGKKVWCSMVPNQMLVLEHFRELPFLLFTAWTPKDAQEEEIGKRRVSVRSIRKSTGETAYEKRDLASETPFHALNVHAPAGKVELVSGEVKIIHHLSETGR